MADTRRSIAYLLANEYQDGQLAASITPQRLRDLIVSLDTGMIIAANYGVKADGATDDTTAWVSVWAAAPNGAIVIAPVGVSMVGSVGITVPAGVTLIGSNFRPYAGSTTKGCVIASTVTTGANPVVTVSANASVKGITIVGPGTDGFGNGTSRPCMRLAGPSATAENVTCTNGANGIDGNYQSVGNIRGCQMQQCNTGMANLVDSHIIGCQMSACGTGMFLSSGSNHNHIIGNRFEFCSGFNLCATGADSTHFAGENTITGNTFDRAGTNAIKLSFCHHFVITGNIFERGGPNATANTSADAHVAIDNSSTCIITGNTSLAGQSDAGTGPFSPSFGVWDGGSNTNCMIKNNIWVYHSVDGTHGAGINSTTTFTTFNTDNVVAAATAPYIP